MRSTIRYSIVVYLGLLLAGTLGAASPDVSEPEVVDWPLVLAEPAAPPAPVRATPAAPQREPARPERQAERS